MTDTTNALRALNRLEANRYLGRSEADAIAQRTNDFATVRAALATAQPEAQPADCNPQIQGADCAAQDTDGKIIAALHAEVARLRRLLGGRRYKTPVSGHDPADVHKESADVDMRQAQGGGEEVVVIDGRRYALYTVRTALLGLAADVAAIRPSEDTER